MRLHEQVEAEEEDGLGTACVKSAAPIPGSTLNGPKGVKWVWQQSTERVPAFIPLPPTASMEPGLGRMPGPVGDCVVEGGDTPIWDPKKAAPTPDVPLETAPLGRVVT